LPPYRPLIENAAPGWHIPALAIQDALDQFFIVKTVGLVGVGVVHWHDSHEVRHNAIAITLHTMADLAIQLIELQTDLGIPHQVMFGATQKAQVCDQCLDLGLTEDVLPFRHGFTEQVMTVAARDGLPTLSGDDLREDGVTPGAYGGGQICRTDLHCLCERTVPLAIGSVT
jgi:hypothetical protein